MTYHALAMKLKTLDHPALRWSPALVSLLLAWPLSARLHSGALAGKTAADPPPAAAPAGAWLRSELFFGLSRPDGSLVSEADWREFLSVEITPRFPAGLSVIETAGQWRDATGLIQSEPSRVLVLLHAPNAEAERRLDEIRAAWCQQQRQECVMKVSTAAKVSLQEGQPDLPVP